MQIEFVAEGVGPFEEEFRATFRPGVNLLRGHNGAGKTWILRAMMLAGREKKLKEGEIRLNTYFEGAEGVLQVGSRRLLIRRGKKPRVETPAPKIVVNGVPDPIRILIDPGLKGERPALKARLKALLDWTGVQSDEEALRELLTEELAEEWLGVVVEPGDDLIDATEAIRSQLHSERRTLEESLSEALSEADRIEGEKKSVLEGYDEDDVAAVDPDPAAAASERMNREAEYQRLKTLREDRLETQAMRESLRREMKERPDLAAETTAVEAARVRVADNEKQARKIDAEIVELTARLRALTAHKEELAVRDRQLQEDLATAEERKREAERQQARWDAQRETLGSPLEIPTEEEVAAAWSRWQDAQALEKTHRTAQKYQAVAARAQAAQDRAAEISARVEFFKLQADSIWDRLSEVVNTRLQSDLIRVADGVEIKVNGRWHPIESNMVSEGQRIAACYELLLIHRAESGVVAVEGATAMDPERLKQLGEMASRTGVVLLMETAVDPPTDRGIVVEHFPKEAVS